MDSRVYGLAMKQIMRAVFKFAELNCISRRYNSYTNNTRRLLQETLTFSAPHHYSL
jgi:hypothetical protein